MIVPPYNNSAGRLLAILSHIDPKTPVWQYLPDLIFVIEMPVPGDKRPELTIAAMSELHRMYHQFLDDMKTAPFNEGQRELVTKRLANLEQIIYSPSANEAIRALTDAEKLGLEFCANTFDQEEKLTEDDIDAIRSSILELQTQVEKADVPQTLRKILLELIRLSDDAIARYNIHGARGLEKAFKGMLAELTELYHADTKEQEEIKKSPAWEKVRDLFVTFDNLLTKIMKYPLMIDKLGGLLG